LNLKSFNRRDLLYSSYGDEEEFTGVAEPNSSGCSSDIVYPRTTSQRVSYVFVLFFIYKVLFFVYSQILKRSSYLQPVIPTEQEDQQLQETVRRN